MSSRGNCNYHSNGISFQHNVQSQGSARKGTGNAFYQSSLERKLELLEARFSRPLGIMLASPAAASEATLQAFSSPNCMQSSPNSTDNNNNNNNNNNNSPTAHSNPSRHTFGFDSPTTAAAVAQQQKQSPPNLDHPSRDANSNSHAFVLQTRSKRGSSSPVAAGTTTLEQVRKAADRHMQKVAASVAQRFVVQSSSCSEVSSESTRLAQNRTVGETAEAAAATTDNLPVSAALAPSTPPVPAFTEHHTKKRKSVPVKKEEPSVKDDILRKVDKNANRNSGSGSSKNNTKGRVSQAQRRLITSNSKSDENKVNTKTDREKSEQDVQTVKPETGASSIPKKLSEKKKSTDPKPCSEVAVAAIGDSGSRHSPTITPLQQNDPNQSGISPRPSNSRDADQGKKGPKTQRSLHNNSSITDFFHNVASKRRKIGKDQQDMSALVESNQQSGPGLATFENNWTGGGSNADSQLQKRVEELEKTCRDQEEQLKAVANNRTILHTALQSTLDQREKELEIVREQKEAWEERSRSVLEQFVRSEASRTARQVRERLASDGARLGRIVYSRAGIRSAAVETWEEGHAIRNLASRQAELREKRRRLEERYRMARKEAQQWLSRSSDSAVATENDLSQDSQVCSLIIDDDQDVMGRLGGMPIRSKLDVMEAVESARVHLEHMRKKERELAEEEKALNDEKSAHIRALKRVASEDASRFRSSPKLHERYVLKCLLGKGGFSEVWRAFDLAELREVAVKIHQLDPRWSEAKKENYTKHVSREYEIHRNVRHPRIVSLYDVFEIDNNSFATVLELCEGTDLDALLKEKRRLPERDARAILLQILSGMQYLSHPSEDGTRQGIIHYDLKPGNILFDEYGDAKITDFGLSKIVDDDPSESMELTSQGAGTYWYLPPEVFVMDGAVRISNKVDVWSIGVIFYQMLFGRRPFGDGQSQDGILSNQTMLNARQVAFPDKPQVSDECKAFIRKCLAYDQTFRPSIAQLCQQPYVTQKIAFSF